MLKIRLQRVGRKHDPSFRVVLTDSRKAASKGEKEVLGTYDPRRNSSSLKADRIKEWMSKGAQTSDTVHNLLISLKIIEGKKRDVRPTMKVEEKVLEEKAPASDAEVKAEEPKEDNKAEEVKEEPKAEAPTEGTIKEEVKQEKPTEEEAKAKEPVVEEEIPVKEEAPTEPPKETVEKEAKEKEQEK